MRPPPAAAAEGGTNSGAPGDIDIPELNIAHRVGLRDSVTISAAELTATVLSLRYQHLNKSSPVAEMGDRLATIDMGRKWGAAVSLPVGELGPHLTQCGMGQDHTSAQAS